MNFESVKELIELIDNSKLIELEMNFDNISLKIKKSEGKLDAINDLKSKEYSMIKSKNVIEECALSKQNLESYIISPVVGLYYSSLKDGNKPFVNLGDKVKRGDVVCIVEILNIIYEIKSDIDGQVVEILASNRCMVEYGQKLFKII